MKSVIKVDSEALALRSRRSALEMVAHSGASHIGSSLSMIDIAAVLYSGLARVSPELVADADRDIVVFSKGHAAAGAYAVLANAGFFPLESLDEFCKDGSPLTGHVTAGHIPGVEFSTGSLGHGLGFGCGVAVAARDGGSERRVFVVMSDGECDEGSVWESALFASHLGLTRLTVIIDRNGLQSFGSTEDTIALEPLADKWRSFGWHVTDVDGHDHAELRRAIHPVRDRPNVVIAHTTKGRGVSFMEGQVQWHYVSPDPDQLATALAELGEPHA